MYILVVTDQKMMYRPKRVNTSSFNNLFMFFNQVKNRYSFITPNLAIQFEESKLKDRKENGL